MISIGILAIVPGFSAARKQTTPCQSDYSQCTDSSKHKARREHEGEVEYARLYNLHDTCCLSVLPAHSRFGSPCLRGVPLGMRRIRPESLDPDHSDGSVAADVLVREEPDEEEDEEEDEGNGHKDDDDDDEGDSGYSE